MDTSRREGSKIRIGRNAPEKCIRKKMMSGCSLARPFEVFMSPEPIQPASEARHSMPGNIASPTKVRPSIRAMLLLMSLGLAGFGIAYLGMTFVVASQGKTGVQRQTGAHEQAAAKPPPSMDGMVIPEPRPPVSMSHLAGFRRHGSTLVGEVKSSDGATLRLVFDARTHTLIGLKVLD
jgi:hypothetical protein